MRSVLITYHAVKKVPMAPRRGPQLISGNGSEGPMRIEEFNGNMMFKTEKIDGPFIMHSIEAIKKSMSADEVVILLVYELEDEDGS